MLSCYESLNSTLPRYSVFAVPVKRKQDWGINKQPRSSVQWRGSDMVLEVKRSGAHSLMCLVIRALGKDFAIDFFIKYLLYDNLDIIYKHPSSQASYLRLY